MSRRRYRFLTNPRFFSFFTEKRMNLVEFFVTFVIFTTVFNIFVFNLDRKQDKAREATLEARLAEARSEVQRLKAPAAKRNGTAQSTPASIKGTSETETQTPVLHAPDDNVDTMSDDTVEVVHTGPLKGLPVDLAKEIHKEYTAASIARAKRYDAWYQQWQAHRKREKALFDKEIAHGDAILANSKKRGEIMLAVYARMSPEQLEAARKEALKTQPPEVVDSFFRKVEEYRTSKSPDQIEQDAQRLQENKEVPARKLQDMAIKLQELKVEREEINRERDELQRTKPLPPNLGLDEFYTEWKKRNSTKPTPP